MQKMDEFSVPEIDSAEVLRRFIASAIAFGYCRESGRQDEADDIQKDTLGAAALLARLDKDWMHRLQVVAATHDDLWARYSALIAVARVDAEKAIPGLRQLPTNQFLIGGAARLAVQQLVRLN